MGQEYLSIVTPDRAVEQAIISLKKGAYLLKYGRRGKPKFYPMRLSTDENYLIWYSGEKEKQLRLSAVTDIIRGQDTKQHHSETERQCISLIYGNGEHTLTLVCKNIMQANTWFLGLRAVISRSHHISVDHIKSKRGAQSCISSPVGLLRRKNRSSQVRSLSVSPIRSFSEKFSSDGLSCSTNIFYSESSPSSMHNATDAVTNSSFLKPDYLSRKITSCDGTAIRNDMLTRLVASTPGSRRLGKHILRDVLIWGEGAEGGCLGGGEVKLDALSPKLLESTMMLDVQTISIGRSHAALVTKQGEVFCWGEGRNGRLGSNLNMDTACPEVVDSLSGVHVKSVSCGEYHTCALTTSGELYIWGDDFGAELVGEENKRSHWVPTRICGSLDGLEISQVACGEWHIGIVSTCGKLFTYGDGTFGVLGHGNVQSVGHPKEVESLRGFQVKYVACGPWHTAAVVTLKNLGGKLFTWGDGDKGKLGHSEYERKLLPTCVSKLKDHDIIQVTCGSTLTTGLSSTGKVYTMGSAVHGQLGNPQARDKSVVVVQGKLKGEVVTEISSGSYHVAVLTSKGNVYTWGKGSNGQLGLGDIKDRNCPTLVEALRDKHVEHIACGSNSTAAVCLHKSISSNDRSVCRGCSMNFGITRKKHNCYNCGLLFCRPCCSKKTTNASMAPDKTKAFRVCDPCFRQLQRAAQSSKPPKTEKNSPRPLLITRKTFVNVKDDSNNISSRMMSPRKYFSENSQCYERRAVSNLGESKPCLDPVASLLDKFPRWGQAPFPEIFRTAGGHTGNRCMRNSQASASPAHLQVPPEPKVVSSTAIPMEENLGESEKSLLKEVAELTTQVQSLTRLCERKERIIRVLTSKLHTMSETHYAGRETSDRRQPIVLANTPPAITQLEETNADSLNGSPTVSSNRLRSLYNRENCGDSILAEE